MGLLKSSFNGNYEYYESRGDKKKIISKAILNLITPYLYDLINDYRIVRRV